VLVYSEAKRVSLIININLILQT